MINTALPKIIVLDDDPTGSQTVHSCLLLMDWAVDTLCLGLRDDAPIFFILTNTRALPPEQAAQVTREVCVNLQQALALTQTQRVMVVSRSDSTLRGHYPLETDVIADVLGPFDAHFLVPAFFEGGRLTLDSTHYVQDGDRLLPVHTTEFAQDPVFGYHYSYLPDYVAEKTQGHVAAVQVQRLVRSQLQQGVRSQLLRLRHNTCVVVDGHTQTDLDQFAQDILATTQQGKRFLFRSAASLLTSLASLPPQPIPPTEMHQLVRAGQPGLFMIGSHVQKTTQQLQRLLHEPTVVGIEIDVAQLRDIPQTHRLQQTLLQQITTAHHQHQTPVVYTSRQPLTCTDASSQLQFGQTIAQLLIAIIQQLPATLGYLVSKGGNTSNTILSHGLHLKTVRLQGQILPGCCLVQTPEDHPHCPQLPVVLCPGNVGDDQALVTVLQRLTPPPPSDH